MATRIISFLPNDILRLLTHYLDGQIPLDAEARHVGISPLLPRVIQILTESKEWTDSEPMHVRFEQRMLTAWDEHGQPVWNDAPDAPKRQ